MVYETRSRSKVGGDEDNTSKNRVTDGEGTSISGSTETDCLELRRSARKTSSKQITTSPSTTRKSDRLQNRTPPVTPTKGKTGKNEKLSTPSPSPSRKSDRSKRNLLPSSSLLNVSEEESNSSGMKRYRKKEKSMKQQTLESENVSTSSNQSLSSIGKKRRRMNSLSYVLLLKMRRKRATPSGINKSKRPRKFSVAIGRDTRHREFVDKENRDSECHIKAADELTDHLAAQLDEGASNSVLEACPDMKSLKIPKFEDSGSAWSPSAGHEKHFFAGFCAACSKQRRVGHGSPKVELCSCVAISNRDCDKLSSPKDEIGVEDIIISGSAENFNSGQSKGAPSDHHMDRNDNVCAVCKQGGKGLLCNGKDCKRCSHPPSLGTPVHDLPSGVWHCLWCLKKKIGSGVHSVTQGVESIWDAREVDVSGTHKQKQYLVKYTGLAHVHNQWVSEAQLLHEAPSLVANFNDNNQVISWNSEWTVPHRLLKKRLLSFSELQGDCHNFDAGDNSECQYEWLVKWRGLDYENATWELENANFLCSPHGQSLVKEYEIRQEKAKQVINKNNKQSLVELSKNWAGSSLVTDIDILNSINKLQDCWWKSQNAAFYDDQEQIVKIILFILSLSTVCWPVLIITASHAISKWEAEFMKWAQSLDCVVYHGSRESRKSIETSEFYSQGGCIMLQVLLTSLETVVEDIHVLNSLSWEVVVIDQCQHSNVSTHIEKIKTLAGLKVLLFNGPIKHTASEYSNLLSLVDSDGDLDKVDLSKSHSNDTLGQLKERFPWFSSCSSKWTSKFLEYWLPVQISELQLELYCDTLLSNINALCSYSKSDPVGALNDIFLNVRKCCDHPYTIWDPSLNPFSKGLSQPEILDIGIKASGKLQLLDKMLSEMKCRQLRTIVLFQSFVGTTPSIGDILDDFLRQRFGENSYERIDAFLIRSKKESALNRFNKLENGRFVFLLENRACKATLKLSSVDNVIIYSSDTNPWNDLRLLEKISFDSDSKPIKVFRLYSSFTVEEQALVIAKQEPDHLHSPNRNLNNTLMWGASDLLSRLDGYYAGDSQASAMHTSTGQLLFSDVIREFSTIISESSENAGMQNSVISKVLHSSSRCTTNLSLFGEQKIKCTGGEAPCVFWKNLLGGRNPQWRHISCPSPSPRSRKRVQFFDGSSPEIGNNVAKKSRKMNSGFDEGGQRSASKEGSSTIRASNESLPTSTTCENEVDLVEHAERNIISDEQCSLHIYLKAEMAKIFKVLKLSEDVKKMAGSFLEYVMENHRISREPVGIFQAFQISLCWTAASFLKQKVDKEEMLVLTKEHLNFECTKDEATTVYLKLRELKKNFSQHMKRNKSTSNSLELSEAGKSGDTCKAPVQPPLEEHTVDEVLSVEHATEVSMGCDHPPEVHDDAPDVAAGCEYTAEANTIADGSAKENFTPINRTDLTSSAGNEKEVTSNSGDGNQTLQEVTSSDDGGLLPQNQCNGTQVSESQITSPTEAGLSEPINAGHRMSDCESVLAENIGNQPASDASGRSPPGEVADMTCNQDSSLQTSGPSSQLVETGTAIQPSPDADLQDPLYNEFDRMRREMEYAAKSHEDLKSLLKSDCEKEIEEMIAEIRNKYNARLQEADTRYSLRKNELGGNLKKVLLNKLLADTFRSKCNDIKPSKLPAVPTSYIQHLRQPSTQPTSRSASLIGSSPTSRQTSAPACMRPPIATPSAGEQTSTRPPSVALSSSGQVVGRQTSAPPACTRPWIASPSAGEQTSDQTCTRLPSDSLSSSSGQQVAGQQTSAPSKPSPVVGESPRRPPSISLVPAGMQTPSPVRMRSPSIGLSSGGQTVVGQHTPASSRPPSVVGKSPRIPNRPPGPPVISSITPSSGNPRLGCEIRAPAPHLQSFRPSMSASTAGPSPILSGRPNLSSYSSSLNHVPIRPGVMSSQNPQHKEHPLSLQQPLLASISDSLSALELHTNLDNQPNPNRPRQSGWPSLSSPANMSSSSSPSLKHFKTVPFVLDSSQLLQKMDHPQNQPSEPDNRPLPAVNMLRLSATELLRNLDNQASATQPKQSGGPGNSIDANSSSSSPSPSLNHVLSQQPSVLDSSKLSQDKEQPQPHPLGANDFNPQNQPAVNILPFSALELLRNVDNQATASANQPND
ncbi:PREDICTED: uncharacterized protein LOC109173545 isoform X2 [Ipomoea nil]|uniref:uncharacterized protein LOC109173545 isoform X2 n=1 Tax=Ipomoea nil TaxID=35883 RepID=UPI000901AB4C|nr:PREDICTED: uncharacterized protein LOC109173545 isoform X2 [Ipomoea nil]